MSNPTLPTRPPILDYPNPVRRRPVVDIPLLVLCVIFASALTLLAAAAPRFELILADFGVEGSAFTSLSFAFLRLCNAGGIFVIWILALAAPFVVPWMQPWPPKSPLRPLSRWPRYIASLLILLTLITGLLAIFLPYINLLNSVASPGRK